MTKHKRCSFTEKLDMRPGIIILKDGVPVYQGYERVMCVHNETYLSEKLNRTEDTKDLSNHNESVCMGVYCISMHFRLVKVPSLNSN